MKKSTVDKMKWYGKFVLIIVVFAFGFGCTQTIELTVSWNIQDHLDSTKLAIFQTRSLEDTSVFIDLLPLATFPFENYEGSFTAKVVSNELFFRARTFVVLPDSNMLWSHWSEAAVYSYYIEKPVIEVRKK